MKTITHICDVCKQSKSEKDLSYINVTTRGITVSKDSYHPPLQIDICKECLEKKGFVVEPKEQFTENMVKTNEKTLEDKLFEILDDIGVMFHE